MEKLTNPIQLYIPKNCQIEILPQLVLPQVMSLAIYGKASSSATTGFTQIFNTQC